MYKILKKHYSQYTTEELEFVYKYLCSKEPCVLSVDDINKIVVICGILIERCENE